MSSDDSDFVVVVNRRKKPTKEPSKREFYRHKSLPNRPISDVVKSPSPPLQCSPELVLDKDPTTPPPETTDKFYYRTGNYPSRGRGYNQQRIHRRIFKASSWSTLNNDITTTNTTISPAAEPTASATSHHYPVRRDPRRGRYGYQNGYQRQHSVPYPQSYHQNEAFVTELVKQQLEYYFSPDNLIRDTFIRRLMDKSGYVNVVHLLEFPRVKSMTSSRQIVEHAIALSRVLELDQQGTRVRCVNNPTQWVIDLEFNPNVPEFVPRR